MVTGGLIRAGSGGREDRRRWRVAGGGGDAVSQGRRLVIRWARDQAGEIRSEVISDGRGGAEGGAEAGGGRERWGCSAAGIG